MAHVSGGRVYDIREDMADGGWSRELADDILLAYRKQRERAGIGVRLQNLKVHFQCVPVQQDCTS